LQVERHLFQQWPAEAKGSLSQMSARTAILKSGEQTMEIRLAHSPDSDDAFMFYALATHKLPTPGYKYTHVLSDIQT
jgi:1,4-dihydroxy-6-naphthoate synthase